MRPTTLKVEWQEGGEPYPIAFRAVASRKGLTPRPGRRAIGRRSGTAEKGIVIAGDNLRKCRIINGLPQRSGFPLSPAPQRPCTD